MDQAARLPSGTVTFLLTDIEGSTRHWVERPDAMRTALARHDALAAAVVARHGGTLVKQRGEGDSLFAVFDRARDAVDAALAFQLALGDDDATAALPLRVRAALHTGEAEQRDGDYFGLVVNRCARLRAAAHGGQTLLSEATAALVRDELPADAHLRALGAHRLKDLGDPERIFQLVHPSLPAEFPALRSLETFSHNLPVSLTTFIGREEETAEVKRLLETTHLLTLTGAGGSGKTRLSLHVAADLVEAYVDGVWLAELAPLSDPARVTQAVAAVLGVREEPGRPLIETLVDSLCVRSLLLMLDNCEHVLDACAHLAETLLHRCPDLRILATSREGLRIAGETSYRVPPLSLPAAADAPPEAALQSEAVRLFVSRATAAQPSFALSAANAGAVTYVCRRLDGIPLAIELAAARVKAVAVERIAERLDNRFQLLTAGSRTALPRHQTLWALVDWSYELLSAPEGRLLQRVSVFAGGWTLEAAEAVCGDDALDLLSALVEKSLVVYEEQGSEPRYHLLETIRQYAAERLEASGEAELVRGRHRDWYLALAEEAAQQIRGPRQIAWLERLDRDHDNLRLALEFCRAESTGVESELRMVVALRWFYVKRGHLSEGRERMGRAISRSSEGPASLRMWALLGAGQLAMLSGDPAAAPALLNPCLEIARAIGDREALALCLCMQGLQACLTGSGGLDRVAAGLEEARSVGDSWLIGFCAQFYGVVSRGAGDLEQAAAMFDTSLALMRDVGDTWGTAIVLLNAAGVAHAQGDHSAARRIYQESLTLSRTLGDRRGMALCVGCLAEIATVEGQLRDGARFVGASQRMLEAIGGSWPRSYALGRAGALTAIRAGLGAESTEAALAEGHALTAEQAVASALAYGAD